MKNQSSLLVCIATFFLSSILYAQDLDFEFSKYETTAKVWGFLKYYHPKVASGKLDWDQELFKLLNEVDKVTSYEELSQLYTNLIEELGKLKVCKKCKTDTEYFDENFDLSWIEKDKNLSLDIADRLRYIEENRYLGKQHYMSYGRYKEFSVINEVIYDDLAFTKHNNLLGLFRYWNIIAYFYPYKFLLDQDWDVVLKEMLPIFSESSTNKEFEYAIKLLVAKVDDSHAWVTFNTEIPKYFPYKVKHIEDNCVISGFFNAEIAEREGLELGDIILKVDGENIQSKVQDTLKITPASNKNFKVQRTYSKILSGGLKDKILLEIKRGDSIFNKVVSKYNFNEFKYYNPPNETAWKELNNNIGYVNMRLLQIKQSAIAMEELWETKGIVFDLRGYPKFSLHSLSRFLNSEERDVASSMKAELKYPGRYLWENSMLKTGHKKNKNPYKGKVVILVDNQSLSLSEFTAMGLRTADNAIIVGSQTAGADGSNTVFKFPRGFNTAATGKGIYYPDGSLSQRVGVKIDIEVNPTIEGLRLGKDEVLEKAIEIIKGE